MEVWNAPHTRHRSCRVSPLPHGRRRHRHGRRSRPRRQAPGPGQLDPDQRVELQLLGRRPLQPVRLVRVRLRLVHGLLLLLAGQPVRLPFSTSCARHDFGYRNYKALGTFSANKTRVDSAFYEDLKRVCAGYSGASKTACNSTAWTYYQAVKAFG